MCLAISETGVWRGMLSTYPKGVSSQRYPFLLLCSPREMSQKMYPFLLSSTPRCYVFCFTLLKQKPLQKYCNHLFLQGQVTSVLFPKEFPRRSIHFFFCSASLRECLRRDLGERRSSPKTLKNKIYLGRKNQGEWLPLPWWRSTNDN